MTKQEFTSRLFHFINEHKVKLPMSVVFLILDSIDLSKIKTLYQIYFERGLCTVKFIDQENKEQFVDIRIPQNI